MNVLGSTLHLVSKRLGIAAAFWLLMLPIVQLVVGMLSMVLIEFSLFFAIGAYLASPFMPLSGDLATRLLCSSGKMDKFGLV